MDDRRRDRRCFLDTLALFIQDGLVSRIRIRDKNTTGIGAYAHREYKPGQQGVIVASWDKANPAQELPIEVCWCMPDPMADDLDFRFRVGLRILNVAA